MTDNRVERIVNQLAELTPEEEDFIIAKIHDARDRRLEKKRRELIDNFEKAWNDLINFGIEICYTECGDETWLQWPNISFD